MNKNRYSLDAHINIVPYLDVFLVLCVILMASASSFYYHTEVDLPKIATHEPLQISPHKFPLIVSVFPDGNYSLKNNYVAFESLNSQKLYNKLSAFYQKDKTTKVFLEADKKCSYEQVMLAMSLMNRAGFTKVGLVTDPAE
jgi:biopolymer transport protein TolR